MVVYGCRVLEKVDLVLRTGGKKQSKKIVVMLFFCFPFPVLSHEHLTGKIPSGCLVFL